MRRSRTRRWLARLSGSVAIFLTCGCGDSPSEPSGSVAGVYTLSVSHCNPSGDSTNVPIALDCPSQNRWTLWQFGHDVSGAVEGSCPPFVWKGQFLGRLLDGHTLEIRAFSYQQSSSHSFIETLTGAGVGLLDSTGFAGDLAGRFVATPTFGGFTGTPRICDSAQMPFRFTREP